MVISPYVSLAKSCHLRERHHYISLGFIFILDFGGSNSDEGTGDSQKQNHL